MGTCVMKWHDFRVTMSRILFVVRFVVIFVSYSFCYIIVFDAHDKESRRRF